jgi:hypothetical protein
VGVDTRGTVVVRGTRSTGTWTSLTIFGSVIEISDWTDTIWETDSVGGTRDTMMRIFVTVRTWVVTFTTDSVRVIVSNSTWTGWWIDSVGGTGNTVVGVFFTSGTSGRTGDNLGRTDWDINNSN